MSALRTPRSSGKVRAARLTDLAALGELSRLCQSDSAETRSLGLPVNGPPIGVFSLFRLPLGAFRPNDLMFVYEEDGRIAGAAATVEDVDGSNPGEAAAEARRVMAGINAATRADTVTDMVMRLHAGRN